MSSVSSLASAEQTAAITARIQAPLRSPSPQVLHWHHRWYPAGLTLYRVDDQATVGTYTLAPDDPPGAATAFTAVAATSLDLPDDVLRKVGWLAATSQADGLEPAHDDARAAAIQLAIWSIADGVPISARTVPDPKIRAAALALVASSGSVGPASLPSYVPDPRISVVPYAADANDQQLRVALSTGSSETSYTRPQKIDLRLDGVWTTFCTGDVTRVHTDLAASTDESVTECGSQRRDGGTSQIPRYRTAILRSGLDTNIATLDFPRSSRTKDIEMYWNLDQDPGMFLEPSDDGPLVVTAQTASLTLVASASIDPSALLDAETAGEQIAIAWLVHSGWIGVVITVAALVLLLFVKDIVRGVGRGLWWLARRRRRRPAAKDAAPPARTPLPRAGQHRMRTQRGPDEQIRSYAGRNVRPDPPGPDRGRAPRPHHPSRRTGHPPAAP